VKKTPRNEFLMNQQNNDNCWKDIGIHTCLRDGNEQGV